MKFQDLRELKKWVDVFNQESPSLKAEFFNPHMFLDGDWSVVIEFNGLPCLEDSENLTSYCLSHSLHAWWAPFRSDIALFVQ